MTKLGALSDVQIEIGNAGTAVLIAAWAAYDVWLLVRGFRTGKLDTAVLYGTQADRGENYGVFCFNAMMNVLLLIIFLVALIAIYLQST